jgi:hypothetical protein
MTQPGHSPLCRGCLHQGADLSHPSPCNRVRWSENRHLVPALSVDGFGRNICSDFASLEAAQGLVHVEVATR